MKALEVPKPQLRPHDVLVQVKAFSIKPVDYKVRSYRVVSGWHRRSASAFWAFGLIDDPKILDIVPFKRKSISIHWELMFIAHEIAETGTAVGKLVFEV